MLRKLKVISKCSFSVVSIYRYRHIPVPIHKDKLTLRSICAARYKKKKI